MSAHAQDASAPAATRAPRYPIAAHDVTNQSGAWARVNAFEADRTLTEAMHREGAAWIAPRASVLASALGDPAWQEHAHRIDIIARSRLD